MAGACPSTCWYVAPWAETGVSARPTAKVPRSTFSVFPTWICSRSIPFTTKVNPFHDNVELLAELIERGNPVLLFENKTLYSRHCVREGALDDLFSWRFIGPRREFAKICIEESESPDAVIVASGSVVFSALEAARRAFLDHELETVILTPAQLHPFPLAPILDDLARAKRILVIEEGIAGGSWAESVAIAIYSRLWGRLENPVICLHSKPGDLPPFQEFDHSLRQAP